MADLLNVADLTHWWGNDLQLSATGDLARSIRDDRSKQHVLRRLLTAEGDYIMHPDYGAGLPAEVGATLDLAKVTGKIAAQMAREASVARAPAPSVSVSQISNGIQANISYQIAPERIPAVLAFDLTN